MKKLLIVGAVILLSFSACKRQLSQDQVPFDVRESFVSHVPTATKVEWEENPDYYFAYFIDKGHQGMALFYKADGDWIETEEALKVKDLTAEQKKMLISFQETHGKKIAQIEEVKKSDSTDILRVEVKK